MRCSLRKYGVHLEFPVSSAAAVTGSATSDFGDERETKEREREIKSPTKRNRRRNPNGEEPAGEEAPHLRQRPADVVR